MSANNRSNRLILSLPKPNTHAVNLAKACLSSANIRFQKECVEYNKASVTRDNLKGYVDNWLKYNKNASASDRFNLSAKTSHNHFAFKSARKANLRLAFSV